MGVERRLNTDGYLRVSPRGSSHRLQATHRAPIVFVDVALPPGREATHPADTLKYIRQHLDLFHDRTLAVVFRWPIDWAEVDVLRDLAGEGGEAFADFRERASQFVRKVCGACVGILAQPVTDEPYIVWDAKPPEDLLFPDKQELLVRLRMAELQSLLEAGGAIWRPVHHHYRLPSGAHSATFVRLADAMPSPHDSLCIASWLAKDISSGLRIVIDSPTLNSLAVTLQLLATRAKLEPPDVHVLDNYYQTSFDIRTAVRGASSVLAIQSVSSTGSLTERIAAALEAASLKGTIHVLVDRRRTGTELPILEPADDGYIIDRWFGLAELDKVYPNADVCPLCLDATCGRLLQIDPVAFAGSLLPRPILVSPSIRAARHNRGLWELANERQALGPLSSPSVSTRERRPTPIDIKLYVGELFHSSNSSAVASALRGRVVSNLPRITRRGIQRTDVVVTWTPNPDDWRPADAPADDRAWEAAARAEVERVVALMFSTIGERTPEGVANRTPPVIWVDRDGETASDDDRARVAKANDILVFDWSAVTGTLLRRLVTLVRSWARGGTYGPIVRGLVVQARPESVRAFADLQDAFDEDLVALWLTYMPMTTRSPFARERRLLSLLKSSLEGATPAPNIAEDDPVFSLSTDVRRDVTAFIEERLDFLGSRQEDWRRRRDEFSRNAVAGEVRSPYAVFWGMPHRLKLKSLDELGDARGSHERSLFGSRLDSVTLLAAAANAVQTVRHDVTVAPEWQQFDMPLAIDAFHEPVTVVAFLRWLGPEEVWWGESPDAVHRTISGLIHRSRGDLPIVVAELLLAAAEGKLPTRHHHIVVEHARSLVQDPQTPVHQRQALHTGIVLLQSAIRRLEQERHAVVDRVHEFAAYLAGARFPVREATEILQQVTKDARGGT